MPKPHCLRRSKKEEMAASEQPGIGRRCTPRAQTVAEIALVLLDSETLRAAPPVASEGGEKRAGSCAGEAHAEGDRCDRRRTNKDQGNCSNRSRDCPLWSSLHSNGEFGLRQIFETRPGIFWRLPENVESMFCCSSKSSPQDKRFEERSRWPTSSTWVAGNTLLMMCLWRRLGVDRLLKAAYEKGTVLSVMSAGSICWFGSGHSDSMSFTIHETGNASMCGAWSFSKASIAPITTAGRGVSPGEGTFGT